MKSPPLEGGEGPCEIFTEIQKFPQPPDVLASDSFPPALPIQCFFENARLDLSPETHQHEFVPHTSFTRTFLKSILTSIDSRDPVVANAWLETLLDVIDLLSKEVVKEEILGLAVSKGHSPVVSSRLAACKLIGKISTKFDQYILKTEVVGIVQSLCQDVCGEVRGSMCNQLAFVAKGLGLDATKSHILPDLVELCSDEEVNVRLAGINTVVQILPFLDTETRVSAIAPLIQKCCERAMREGDVTLPATAHLFGRICHCLHDDLNGLEKQWFLKFYCTLSKLGLPDARLMESPMPDLVAGVKNGEYEAECRKQCAYNLPGMVIFAGGSNAYRTTLHETVTSLIADPSVYVRSTVANGFHQLCSLVGGEVNLLKKGFVYLLRCESMHILSGIVGNLPHILACFHQHNVISPQSDVLELLEIVDAIKQSEETISSTSNWRVHTDILRQMASLALCLSDEIIYSQLVPLMFVRMHTARPIPCRLAAVRTLLVYMQHLESQESKEHICTTLISGDRVANIRLKLVLILPRLKGILILPEDKTLLQELETVVGSLLVSEEDVDVYAAVSSVISHLDKVEVEEKVGQSEIEVRNACDSKENLQTVPKENSLGSDCKMPKSFTRIGSKNMKKGISYAERRRSNTCAPKQPPDEQTILRSSESVADIEDGFKINKLNDEILQIATNCNNSCGESRLPKSNPEDKNHLTAESNFHESEPLLSMSVPSNNFSQKEETSLTQFAASVSSESNVSSVKNYLEIGESDTNKVDGVSLQCTPKKLNDEISCSDYVVSTKESLSSTIDTWPPHYSRNYIGIGKSDKLTKRELENTLSKLKTDRPTKQAEINTDVASVIDIKVHHKKLPQPPVRNNFVNFSHSSSNLISEHAISSHMYQRRKLGDLGNFQLRRHELPTKSLQKLCAYGNSTLRNHEKRKSLDIYSCSSEDLYAVHGIHPTYYPKLSSVQTSSSSSTTSSNKFDYLSKYVSGKPHITVKEKFPKDVAYIREGLLNSAFTINPEITFPETNFASPYVLLDSAELSPWMSPAYPIGPLGASWLTNGFHPSFINPYLTTNPRFALPYMTKCNNILQHSYHSSLPSLSALDPTADEFLIDAGVRFDESTLKSRLPRPQSASSNRYSSDTSSHLPVLHTKTQEIKTTAVPISSSSSVVSRIPTVPSSSRCQEQHSRSQYGSGSLQGKSYVTKNNVKTRLHSVNYGPRPASGVSAQRIGDSLRSKSLSHETIMNPAHRLSLPTSPCTSPPSLRGTSHPRVDNLNPHSMQFHEKLSREISPSSSCSGSASSSPSTSRCTSPLLKTFSISSNSNQKTDPGVSPFSLGRKLPSAIPCTTRSLCQKPGSRLPLPTPKK